ncbi:hypothetical protein SLS62_005970 [Diatrype stigma]|uniref:SnoaL-like domain-containing protein n=1 Tax=Diatrype stigma TaxID=117547 RepID=A0AAN9UQH0_9PEZI
MADQTLADLQRRLQKLEDKEWDAYANCFLENGAVKFESGGDVIGRANIGAQMSSIGNRFQGLLHSLTNIDLVIDGDQATGSCYLWFAAIMDTSKPHEYHGFGGPYMLEFSRTDAGWKIASVQLKKVWAQNPDTEGVFGG